MLADLTKRELLVVLAIIRETYGYNRKEHRISGTQISRLTGICRHHAASVIVGLERRKVVLKRDYNGCNILGINKKYREWLPSVGSPKSGLVPKRPPASPKTATKLVPNRDTTKDSKDNYKDKERGANAPAPTKGTRFTANFLWPESWFEFVEKQGLTEVEWQAEAAKFTDYWIAQPGQKGVKLDWFATWRNWIRRTKENGHGKANGRDHSQHRLSAPERVIAAYNAEFADEPVGEPLGTDGGDLWPQVD